MQWRTALAATLVVFVGLAEEAFREWRDAQGRAITAKLVACDGTMVTLERKDGKSSRVPLGRLSEADRAYATSVVVRAGGAGAGAQKAVGGAGSALPASFSLRPAYKAFRMDVDDQGRRGSCLIFGVINPLEFHLARLGKPEKLSERFLQWGANQVRGMTADNEGYRIGDVLKALEQYGYTSEWMFGAKYRDHGGVGRPDKEALADAKQRGRVQVQFFGGEKIEAADIQAICGALVSSNPVTFCLTWPEQVTFGNRKLIKPWKKSAGNHAIVAVGYVLEKDLPGGGAFEVRNSWGDNWGKDGHALLSFEWFQKTYLSAFAVRPE